MSQLKPKSVSASSIDGQVYKVFPNDLNAHHTAFGGMIMAKCDRLALVVAERHSGKVCVTASVDSMHFRAPAKDGDTLVFKISVNRAWRSSMEIGVKVLAENSYTGALKHIVSAYFTFVALDEFSKPINIPDIAAESDDQHRRYEEADIRRQQRLKNRAALADFRASKNGTEN